MRFVLVLSLLLSIALLGCGSEDEAEGGANPTPVPGDGEWSIEEARDFDEFTLYWLGESYEGYPLTKIIRYSYGGEDSVIIIYGDCTPKFGEEGGCPPPLSIRIDAFCTRPPEMFAQLEGISRKEFRGVDALVGRSDITIWSGDVTITMFFHEGSVEDAAMDLMALDDAGPRAGEPLPAPRPEDCPTTAP